MQRSTLKSAGLFLLFASVAAAHTSYENSGGFVSGFMHPLTGMDHMLAMFAVGLWGAQLGMPAVWMLPVAFPMVMAVGGMIGMLGISFPFVEIGVAGSALALGACVLFEYRPKQLWLAAVLVGFFGLFHGNAHGTELPEGSNGMLYSIGFVIATGLIHMSGVAIGLIHRWPFGRIALRAAGAAVGVAGTFFLWNAVS